MKSLSFLDRWLTLWIVAAMAVGLALGAWAPGWTGWISSLSVGTTSIPLAVGLILMMYPPLAKVRYEALGRSLGGNRRLLILSLVQNWLVGPLLMTGLAVLFLGAHPGYLVGVVLVGLARCIAMVVVWNDLAGGHREFGVGLVALNALFQVLFYAFYIWLFITVFLGSTGLVPGVQAAVSFWDSAATVLIYLGIPFAAGVLSRLVLVKLKGQDWYETKFTPRISPLTLIFLLFTIVVMFSLQGSSFLQRPADVLLVALPLLIYFVVLWFSTLFIARALGGTYAESAAAAFSAASNDFELAIAVAIALWGAASPQAFAAVIGPLIEVPVMVVLVRVALTLKTRLWKENL
ncbi:MAG: ACR3 family arsenite efflux transporter [Spirochaetales bacterium]